METSLERGKAEQQSTSNMIGLSASLQQDFLQIVQGYLLGTNSLSATQDALEAAWQRSLGEDLKNNPDWKSEDWASK